MQNDEPDTKPCLHCANPLPRTGTYCLACDTPVSTDPIGLSVAESHAVQRGRPAAGAALIALVTLVLGALAVALVLVIRPHS